MEAKLHQFHICADDHAEIVNETRDKHDVVLNSRNFIFNCCCLYTLKSDKIMESNECTHTLARPFYEELVVKREN